MTINKDKCTISLSAANRSTQNSRDLSADLDLKSSWSSLRNFRLTAGHTDNGREFAHQITLTANKMNYAYKMNAVGQAGYCAGDVTISHPSDEVSGHPLWEIR